MANPETNKQETNGKDKHQSFRKLCQKRVTKLIKDMHLVANLANRNNYEHTEKEKQAVFAVIEAEFNLLKKAFNTGEVTADGFKLPD